DGVRLGREAAVLALDERSRRQRIVRPPQALARLGRLVLRNTHDVLRNGPPTGTSARSGEAERRRIPASPAASRLSTGSRLGREGRERRRRAGAERLEGGGCAGEGALSEVLLAAALAAGGAEERGRVEAAFDGGRAAGDDRRQLAVRRRDEHRDD